MRRTAAALATVLAAGLVTTAGVHAALAEPAANPCDTPADHQIAEVQGAGDATPLSGQTVRVEGVVTGDFQASDQLKGFFLQDPTPDGDPKTSDGLFVYSTKDVKVGDRVLATGKATEYNGLTELSPVSAADVCGTGKVAPAKLSVPPRKGANLESYEGVLTRFSQKLTATETYNLGRYGEVSLSSKGRLFQPTDDHGSTQAGNDARRLLLDDGSTVQDPKNVPYTSPNVLRIGDTTTNLTGVLSYGFGTYRLEPTQAVHFARTNPPPAHPDNVRGDVKVASFNTLNWFTTLNKRGADSEEEKGRQLAKLVASLKGLNADAFGLMEVENNGDTGALKTLVDKLNEAVGAGTYTYVTNPNPGTDEIHVGIIYKPARLTPVGQPHSSSAQVFERPPLVQAFKRANGGGDTFTMIVNHFKSKGCTGATGPDKDQGDGQSCFNARRVSQAKAIAELAAGEKNPLVLGDLNAYTAEDPIKTLTGSGLVGQTERFVKPAQRYSYVFDGQSGELDHVLAGKALSNKITGATIWHINSDEPTLLDYNTEYNQPQFYKPDQFRSSDHDPVLIGLSLR
ncbi:ExeM/NucH family extracellular endonuclease [Actinomadura barringtoniae]|uniref:ExeM/NucH family extracellular endonuclease n=1 Tax=Actinomadura barringtoniae TaxID=1427535 RepID=A0A939PC17_9ACTN|nr:ExeM/NucH family extracellular endonuclease [Actinomadura barringtoniae]MBO2445711.1 ExeM/NucH family extracellular endonuclease [Actinomadura barringtoniae]